MASGPIAPGMQLPTDRAIEHRSKHRRGLWRGLLASSLLHVVALVALLAWWQPSAPEVIPIPPIPVVLLEQPSAEGASGNGDTASLASAPAARQASTPTPEAREETPVSPPAPPAVAAPRIVMAPLPSRKPQKHVVAALPESAPPPPQPAAMPPTEATAQTPPAPPATAAAPVAAPSAGQLAALAPGAGGPGQGAQGSGPAAIGNGAGPGDDYLERVRRRLQEFKEYPEDARNSKEQGTVQLEIKLARNGTLLGASIAKSSGYPLLDEAALKMAQDASPLPPFPPQFQPAEGTLVVPEDYKLGFFERVFH